MLAQIHKKQTAVLPPPRPEQANRGGGERRQGEGRNNQPPGRRPDRLGTTLLKWFTLATAIGLCLETALGIYMAFKFNPGQQLIWILLLLGTLLPLATIVF